MSIAEGVEVYPEYFGEKTVVLSKSGYGKSHTVRVIIEEGLEMGATFTVIDPQDAYLNLPEFSYIEATEVKSAKQLGALLSQSNRNVVIRMKRLGIDEQNKFLHIFLSSYRKHVRKGIQTIVIDEVHKYAPEKETTLSKSDVRGMSQENRSDGLGFIAISQRVSRMDKTVISQADHIAAGRVSAMRDKMDIQNYLENKEDVGKISKLERGQFYFYGFGLEEPVIAQVRKSRTTHSGNSPKNLLRENTELFNTHIGKIVKKGGVKKNMSESITSKGDVVNNVVPGVASFMDLATLGAKISLGGAVGGITGNVVGGMFASPIPMVSSRTIASTVTTVSLYAAYRFKSSGSLGEVLKYSAAGSAVYTAGSLIYDGLAAANIKLPSVFATVYMAATGVPPVVSGSPASTAGTGSGKVDTDTGFA